MDWIEENWDGLTHVITIADEQMSVLVPSRMKLSVSGGYPAFDAFDLPIGDDP
jgi:hypothetical protein